jgi:hypothetical protein
MLTKSQTYVWGEVGGSHHASTSVYSETLGELDPQRIQREYKNEQHKKAMNAPIDEDKLRRAGM